MGLHQIEYFLSVAKHLNFTKAAQECNISQSALSQQIKHLENSLDIKLFHRDNRKTSLTPAGEVFLDYFKEIIEIYNKAVFEANQVANLSTKKITIGYCGPWEKDILPRIVSEYNNVAPDISLQFRFVPLNNIMQALTERSVDFAFAAPYFFEIDDTLNVMSLAESNVNVVVNKNHPLAGINSVNGQDIRLEKFVLINNSHSKGLQEKAKNIFKALNIQYSSKNIQLQDDLDSVILLVKSGLGVSLLPKTLKDSLSPHDLHFIDIKNIDEKFYVGVAWLNNEIKNDRCLSDFTDFLKDNHCLCR